ncbi:hypothetical protein BDV93DRAFT_565536 [Ceratobasidium sp. AG-I]|nr:hypothetical protein BDV93DRAFT_565536 [Ceratobasidium sp. AG-I]
MEVVSMPRVIVVYFQIPQTYDNYHERFRAAGCLAHACMLTDAPTPSVMNRMLRRRKKPLARYVKDAYEFVVGNYQAGDSVVIIDTLSHNNYDDSLILQNNRHTVIRELSAALDNGSLHKSSNAATDERIPIKCVFLCFSGPDPRRSGMNELLSYFPPTTENLLCFNKNTIVDYRAYAIQRGSYGRIKRKEVRTIGYVQTTTTNTKHLQLWRSPNSYFSAYYWVLVRLLQLGGEYATTSQPDAPRQLQTSHIIQYHPVDLRYFKADPNALLSTVTYFNCTQRRYGLPFGNAIPTGGQRIRIAFITEPGYIDSLSRQLVWSSESFAEGEREDACSRPPFGPKSL